MNLSEFKAWFEGFTENIDGPPNERQWKKIAAKVKEIALDPTPLPVFIDRYVKPYQPYWQGPIWPSYTTGGTCGQNMKDVSSSVANLMQQPGNQAFAELGRIEHQEMN